MKPAGHALIEWLIAVPVVLLIGFSILQWALIWQARHALEYGAQGAALSGATSHGGKQAIEQGFGAAMGPFWGLADRAGQQQKLSQGIAAGWFHWQRIWPPPEAFTDFAEPALDDFGRRIAGQSEIPNDNLRFRPRGPGARSGLTLLEANRIGLQVTYGVPLVVPLISSLMVRVMEVIDGCASGEDLQLVALDLGKVEPTETRRAWACRIYRAPAATGGKPVLRLPIRVAASAPMQSALRRSAEAASPPSREPVLPPEARVGPEQPLTAPDDPNGPGGPGDNPFAPRPPDNPFSGAPDSPGRLLPPEFDDDDGQCEQA